MAYLSSCQKEYSEQFVPYTNNLLNSDTVWNASSNQRSVNIALTELTAAPMLDSFTLATGGTVNFPENLSLLFPPNCVGSAATTPLTPKLRVQVTYLKRKGDFIRYGKPTMSYDYLLQSGGSFNIVLTTQNGVPVSLAPGISFKIKYRNAAPSNDMKFFYETNTWVNGADSAVTWTQGNGQSQGSVSTWQQFDTASQTIIKGYEMFSSRLNWVNCDYFNDTSQPYTRMNVSLPLNFTNANTNVYAVFKSKNIVAGLNSEASSKTFYLKRMPIGSEIVLVTVSKIGNDYYLGKKEATISNANLISVSPEPKSLTDISNYLNSL